MTGPLARNPLAVLARRARLAGIVRPLRRALEQRPSPVFRGERVALVGAFRPGEEPERLARELEDGGATVRRVDVCAPADATASRAAWMGEALAALNEAELTDIVVHLNPPAFYDLLGRLDPRAIGDRCFVLSVMRASVEASQDWRPALMCADEIWVPAPVGRDALEAVLPAAAARILVRRPSGVT